jgi:hypothetical protein
MPRKDRAVLSVGSAAPDGGDRAPFLQARPKVLDQGPVGVDPGRAGDRRVGALGGDRGPRAHAPDALAAGVRGVAPRSPTTPRWRRHQAARRAGSRADLAPAAARALDPAPARRRWPGRGRVGGHARLGAVAAARAAIGLRPIPRRDVGRADRRRTLVAPRAVGPLSPAPAASWRARTLVPSRHLVPSATPRCCAGSGRRSRTPSFDQRMSICAASHHDRQSRSSVPQGGRPGPAEGAELGREGAPLGPILVPPKDRRDRPPRVLRRRLATRPSLLDQRRPHRPSRVREHLAPGSICHAPNVGAAAKL